MNDQPGEQPAFKDLIKVFTPFAKGQMKWLVGGLIAAVVAAVFSLLMPQVLRSLIDGPISHGDRSAVVPAALVVLTLGLGEGIFTLVRRMLVLSPSTRIEFTARMHMFHRLVDLQASFHDEWPSGQLLTRITQDLNLIRRWIAFGAIQLITSVAMLIVGIISMMTISPLLGLLFLVFMAPLLWVVIRFERVYSTLSRQTQDKSGDVATVVEESVKGVRVLKAFGRAPEALGQLDREASQLRDLEVERGNATARLVRGLVLIPNLTIGVLLVVAIWLGTQGLVTMGGVVAFFATATILRLHVQGIGFLLGFTWETMTAMARFKEVIDTPTTVADPTDAQHIPARAADAPRGAQLEFRDVDFKFSDQGPHEDPLLHGLNLSVAPGERLALVGLTGSGKSTLINLAARLYDVTAGAVLVDGVDVRQLTRHELREQLAVAFEDPTLFKDSVRNNVALGAPELSDEELQQSLDVASADFVERLPEQAETVIGEEGTSLSGGQRQRLALARAVAMRPRLMLLDDPLSALDVHTEAAVTQALDETLGDTTVLIVAHRPSTVALADRVALLDRGHVVATGTHDELLETDERYRYVISSFDDEEVDA